MRAFKLIDIIISIVLITGSLVILAFNSFDETMVLNSYFIIGGWQVISMIVHQVDRRFAGKKSFRLGYHIFVLALLIYFGLLLGFMLPSDGAVSPLALNSFLFLAVISPVLAIIYTGLCIKEWNDWKKDILF